MTASTPAAITIAAAATNLLRHDLRRNIRRPSMPVRSGSELDSGDLVEEPFRDRPDGAVADLHRVAALEQQLADADHRRRRSGREGLGHDAGADLVDDFVDVDVLFARADAGVAGEA